jgi:Immunity protein Imm1
MMGREMPVRRLIGDKWEGISNEEEIIENPTSFQFKRMFDRMDAKTYTMLTLQSDGECHLAIGGGAGQYVVYATFDNHVFWNLVRREGGSGTVMLNAGGQEGDYPARQIIDAEQTRQAGLSFLQSGQLDQALTWEKA